MLFSRRNEVVCTVPRNFPIVMLNDVLSPRYFQVEIHNYASNIDMQVHYCVHSVEGSSVLK